MLTGEYRRIYYYHLKKCGGSTLNQWLDTLTDDERTQSSALLGMSFLGPELSNWGGGGTSYDASITRAWFHWTDVIHSHGALRQYVPDKTFCFTILRDPVRRLVSQISDWQRLTPADTMDHPPEIREYVEDSRRMALSAFLEKHAEGGGRLYLDNHLTRSLAAGRMGGLVEDVADPERLCEIALQSLENDYHLVGLTEQLDLSRNAFCGMVGLVPAAKIPTINMTRKSDGSGPDTRGAREMLKRLTRVDRIVYDRACQLFEQRHRKTAERYDAAEFEALHAGGLLHQLRGIHRAGATSYSVRQPLVGSGFHGRDGAGLASCAVWTGPETRTTLYIPTPANMSLSLLVWIRGYVDGRQREQLRVRADGKTVAHHFAVAEGYADLLVIPTRSGRDFVRLELEIDEVLESGEPGEEQYDSRERGIAFDSYGWCPA